MELWKKFRILFPAAALLGGLLGCAGSSSDGAAGGLGDGAAGPLGGQNVLGGNGQATGDSGLPGADGGEGVPSTQQSETGAGVGGLCEDCKFSFIVTVRVTRGSLLQHCSEAGDEGRRNRTTDFNWNGDPVMAPPENPVAGPKVVLFYKSPYDHAERIYKVGTSCDANGLWRTQRGALSFCFPSASDSCGGYSVRASASWDMAEERFFSNEFNGPPMAPTDAGLGGIPIPLTIDLGPENLYNDSDTGTMAQ